MHIGAVLPHHEIGRDPGALRDYAQGVEALGLHHLLVYDHVLGADRDRPGGFEGPYDKDVGFHEPFTFLSFVAGVTRTLELATAVLILPQRQTVLVAKQAAELAIVSGDRFRIGIGVGWNEVEYAGLGVPFACRGRRQEEQVGLLRALWSEETVDVEGEFHRVERAGINPRPARPIPIWFGGSAPALLDRCSRLGDGWLPLGSPSDKSRDRIAFIRRRRGELGLSMDGFEIQAQAQYAGGDPERWRSHLERWLELGATRLAVATHNAGPTGVDGHLTRLRDYLLALAD